MNLFSEQQWRNRHREQTSGQGGRRGRRSRERYGERNRGSERGGSTRAMRGNDREEESILVCLRSRRFSQVNILGIHTINCLFIRRPGYSFLFKKKKRPDTHMREQ